ncbi:tetratricopeptide repeat protein [Altericroceibacterium indicum]
MALTPKNNQIPADKAAIRQAAEHDVLLREVDEAVRQDQMADIGRKYGKPILAIIVVALLAFGGWLWWDSHQESKLEANSEELVKALDNLKADNLAAADGHLKPLAQDGSNGMKAAAIMLEGGMALQQNKPKEAAKLFDSIAADKNMPETYRNLATIRSVSATFDDMEPQKVIDRLKPLAVPGEPWFGSAAELVGMAYLAQGKNDLAGPLFASVAKDENAPQGLRSRTRQLAGLLGYDAVDDVDKTLQQLRVEGGDVPAPGAAAAAQ